LAANVEGRLDMITGAHVILFGPDAEAARSFLRDTLELPSVDAGGGWLIFALPPAEIAVHPGGDTPSHELYLMCDDLEASVAQLAARGVEFTTGISEQSWGRLTSFRIPGAGEIGLYEPKHPRPG
jgi:hypothetical protein